jgi:nucleotide-binding universal stress UspA family protein
MSEIRHILVAVDFDSLSERALDYAVDLAERLGAEITVLHTYGLPVLNALDAEYIPSANEAQHKAAEGQKRLDALIAARSSRKVKMTSHLRVGAAAEEIVAQAKELGVDLVVVGTHGRGAIGRALLGSVATAVLRDAPVPVLTVRAQG